MDRRVRFARDPEVDDLDDTVRATADVLRLDVPMNEAARLEILNLVQLGHVELALAVPTLLQLERSIAQELGVSQREFRTAASEGRLL